MEEEQRDGKDEDVGVLGLILWLNQEFLRRPFRERIWGFVEREFGVYREGG